MPITFTMVIDELKRLNIPCSSALDSPSCSLAEVRQLPSAGEVRDDCLYVCPFAAMEQHRTDVRPQNAIYVADCTVDEGAIERLLADGCDASDPSSSAAQGNTVFAQTDMGVQDVCDLLGHFFAQIYAWDISLQQAVLKGEGFERILELSSSVLKNHICISDSSLKLVCVTQGNTPEDDPVVMSLLKNGYHTSDVIGDFRRTNRLDRWERSTGQIIVNTDRDLTPYDTVTRIFKYNRRSFLYVVMTCNIVPLSDGLLDIFQNLVDILSFAAEREWSKADVSSKPSAVFLKDALGKQQDGGDLTARAKALHLPLQGSWAIAVLENVQPEHYSVDRLITELTHVLDEEGILRQKDCIVIWKTLRGGDGSVPDGFQRPLLQLAEDYDLRCGISCVFSALEGIYRALDQAHAAAACLADPAFAPLLVAADPDGGENRATTRQDVEAGGQKAEATFTSHCFDDCLWQCMEAGLMPNAPLYLSSTYGRKLLALSAETGKSHSDDIRILYTFLACERNAAETGRRLFMHRNTVLYRIGTIKKTLGCSLEDPDERFCIMQLCQLIMNGQRSL